MIALSTIPVEVSEEAARYIEQLGLQEPLQRMLDEIPKRFQAVHWIKVILEYIVDEGNRPSVAIDVAREHPGAGDDPSGRQFGRWVIETFPPEIWSHLVVMDIYVDP
jgi:hypothetical protein